jgi:hypothetical protein
MNAISQTGSGRPGVSRTVVAASCHKTYCGEVHRPPAPDFIVSWRVAGVWVASPSGEP